MRNTLSASWVIILAAYGGFNLCLWVATGDWPWAVIGLVALAVDFMNIGLRDKSLK